MWKYDINDPNDPNNPFGNCYKPRYVYELHIVHGGRGPRKQFNVQPSAVQEKPVRNNPHMVTPYVEVDTPITDIPFVVTRFLNGIAQYLITGNLSMSFKGEIKSQSQILKTTFEGSEAKIALQFQSDGNKALNNVSTELDLDPANLGNSSCTTTISNSPYTSTGVSVDGGMPSVDVSTNDSGTGSSGVMLSAASPTSLTFHYDTEDFKTTSGNSTMKGHVQLQVTLDVTPVNQNDASPSPSISKAWDQIKSKAEETFLSGAGFATGNAGLIVTLKPTTPMPIINNIIQSMVQALENVNSGGDSEDQGSAVVPPPPVPEVAPI